MFKTLFSKLLATIFAVLTVSFVMLSAIISNFANNFESREEAERLVRTAEAARTLSATLKLGDAVSLEDFLADETTAAVFRSFAANTTDLVLIFATQDGRILRAYCGEREETSYRGQMLSQDFLMRWEADPDGEEQILFGEEHPYSAVALSGKDGGRLGILLTYSAAENWGALTRLLTRTVILTSLWILLGALVVLYFFCERIADPLRQMNALTKQFAKGRFEVRVPVEGYDEIAELATAFNNMAESLEQLETMRNSFIANVSHDLRTPMTTILGFIEGITSGVIPEEKHAYYLGVISEEVRRLSRLVTDLLDLSRLESGTRKFNFTKFDICETARQILISCEQRIEGKRLEVVFDADRDNMLAYADRDAIHQVLYNLCDNAIKFAAEGGEFRVALAFEKERIAVTVYNDGEGIPPEDLPFVFERFYKSDKSRGRDKTGAGLGLYIVKTIVEAHGGRIEAKSDLGEGCAFCFTVPRAED